ncbi:hypothetical protein E2C01_056319 [Portunus trituberculatus]|uniref:Uncharacterized protein n=1 Tax=Portunus trituberculatus TaxID=210409 RepID=A0A5B7GXC7_PORTR|nr:hypothetical protein [Portunus trituberculatus]
MKCGARDRCQGRLTPAHKTVTMAVVTATPLAAAAATTFMAGNKINGMLMQYSCETKCPRLGSLQEEDSPRLTLIVLDSEHSHRNQS